MNKEQFIETLSGFVAPKLIETLVKQADNNGHFKNSDPAPKTCASEQDSILKAVKAYNHNYIKHIPDNGCEQIAQILNILCGKNGGEINTILDAVESVFKIYGKINF